MREKLMKRLEELQAEKAAGQKMLGELEEQRLRLTETMLRIDGAIQVIQEVIGEDGGSEEGDN